MSWQSVQSLCEKRRRYIGQYSSSLQSGAAVGSKVQNQEIKDLDSQLEPEVRRPARPGLLRRSIV